MNRDILYLVFIEVKAMQKNQLWKDKVQEIFQVCQDELKKTTEIGKKMLSASKTNSNLHEAYEEIGRLVVKAIQDGELKWSNQRIEELLSVVENCEDELHTIETEVHNIKFSPGPIDVSGAGPQAAGTTTTETETTVTVTETETTTVTETQAATESETEAETESETDTKSDSDKDPKQ